MTGSKRPIPQKDIQRTLCILTWLSMGRNRKQQGQAAPTMAESYLAVLKREFTGADGSFLIQLRPNLTWDKEAFSKLVAAMEASCKACEGRDKLDRWQAEGFWFMSWFVKDWTAHENFPRPQPQEYYENALERLNDLAYWFFFGYSPYEDGHVFDPL